MHSAESYEEIILNSNKAAIQLLKNKEFGLAKPYLETSVNILSSKKVKNSKKLLPITLNNYGCYYKRLGKLPEALKYFDSALRISQGKDLNVTETYLNVSNVFLQSGKYSDALIAASNALKSLKNSRKYTKTAVLVYKTLGNLYRLMGLRQESQQMYLKGLMTSQKVLGNAHKLTKDMENSYDAQKRKKSPENFVKLNSSRLRFHNLTPDLKPKPGLIHEYIPTPMSHQEMSTIRRPNASEPKGIFLTPSYKTQKFLKKARNFSDKRVKKSHTNKNRIHRIDHQLIPIPQRGYSLSSPKLYTFKVI